MKAAAGPATACVDWLVSLHSSRNALAVAAKAGGRYVQLIDVGNEVSISSVICAGTRHELFGGEN